MHRPPAAAPAALILHCPYCQGLLANDGSLAGRMAYCANCLNPFQMPGASTLPVARAATPDSLARSIPAVVRQPLDSLPIKPVERPRLVDQAPPLPLVDRMPRRETPREPDPPRAPAASQPSVPAAEAAAPPTSLPRPTDVPPVAAPPVAVPAVASSPAVAPVPAAPTPVASTPIAPAPVQAPTKPPTQAPPASVGATAAREVPAPATPAAKSPAKKPEPIDPRLLSFLPTPPAAGPPPAIVVDEPDWKVNEPACLANLSAVAPRPVAPALSGPFPAVDGCAAEPVDFVPADLAPEDDNKEEGKTWQQHTPAFLTSAVTHAVLLIALAMWIITRESPPTIDVLALWAPHKQATLDSVPFTLKADTPEAFDPSTLESLPAPPAELEPAPAGFEVADLSPAEDVRAAIAGPSKQGVAKPSGFDGRGDERRQKMLREGGTPESESAVALGLKWLKEHQYPDGGWRFDHTGCANCKGACDDPGSHDSTTGATALALLPFLGAGQTHTQGKYQDVVRRGLYYLIEQQTGKGNDAGDFRGGKDGDMYCHGLAATTLCEAYGMSRDKMLMTPAQKSLDFITFAQDQRGGGWRYQPHSRGDTSVVGWQIMALKSGHMAYLKVPKSTITRASNFLDSVQNDSGATYGYQSSRGGTLATVAIGLLCRMHLGWSREHPGVVRGVQYLSEEGPSRNNMYHNYYATQVLRQYGGPQWTRWNEVMREHLINTQVKAGHEEGSWAGRDTHLSEGGRLYVTSLSIMTLEVYYRHMPLYREDAVKNDFKP